MSSDSSIGRMLARVGDQPSDEFVARLHRDLLAELVDDTSSSTDAQVADTVDDGADIALVDANTAGGGRHRRLPWPILVGAAAVLAVVVGTVIVVSRPSQTSHTSSPTSDGPFSINLSTDLTTSDGAALHFDGQVELGLAVESNESSSQPTHDVLLLPKITGRFTNSSDAPESLSVAYVEVLLRSDVGSCVVNSIGCDTGIVRGDTSASNPTTDLPPDASVALSD